MTVALVPLENLADVICRETALVLIYGLMSGTNIHMETDV